MNTGAKNEPVGIITDARIVEVGDNKHGDSIVVLRVDQRTAKLLARWLYDDVRIWMHKSQGGDE